MNYLQTVYVFVAVAGFGLVFGVSAAIFLASWGWRETKRYVRALEAMRRISKQPIRESVTI